MKIAPSIVSADLTCLENVIEILEKNGIDLYHVDVMDGHFVPNITVGPDFIKNLRKLTELPIESHLMITNPEKYVKRFMEAGSDMITLHSELSSSKDILKNLMDVKRGIAINPSTPAEILNDYYGIVDYVLIMSVNPGFSGQKFIPDVIPKLIRAREIFGEKIEISIDGGINSETVKFVKNYVDIICSASGIFSGNIEENLKKLRLNSIP